MNISKYILYFNVIFNNFDFLLICFIVVVVIVIDCGEINFVVILLIVLVDIRSELFVLICCVIEV